MTRRRQGWRTKERLSREAQARGAESTQRCLNRRVHDTLSSTPPTGWGLEICFLGGIFVESRVSEGGLPYSDALAIVPQVTDAYNLSRTHSKGQHVYVTDETGGQTYVHLQFDRVKPVLKYAKVRDEGRFWKYGKSKFPTEIFDYEPPLDRNPVKKEPPRRSLWILILGLGILGVLDNSLFLS